MISFMKQLFSILFAFSLCAVPSYAQFGVFSKIYKGAKTVKQVQKAKKQAQENYGDQKILDKAASADTSEISKENKKRVEEAQKKAFENDPHLKKMKELQGDTAALNKYLKEKYGGMSNEEIVRKMYEERGMKFDEKEYQDQYSKSQKISEMYNDPVFKKIMKEQRQPTQDEASYFNEKYGTSIGYEGMEAYKDSIGVFARIEGIMKPMSITKSVTTTYERPTPDLGKDEIKKYVQKYINLLKEPLSDRIIADSIYNYIIYNNTHADEQFKGIATFTIFSNPQYQTNMTVNDLMLRKLADFIEPIDPKNIFVFKVNKGIGCRFMEYRYNKISYRQSELTNYISKHLVNKKYIDAKKNQKKSDEELFKALYELDYKFKDDKLSMTYKVNNRTINLSTIPPAENVKISSNVRKVGGNITALDLSIEAEPGEYAFIIRDPEVEEELKQTMNETILDNKNKNHQNIDFTVIAQGAFFFTIK